MAGGKKKKKQAQKAQEKAGNLSKALVEAKATRNENANLKKEIKALAVDARFNASASRVNNKRLRVQLMKFLRCLANPVRENQCRVPDGLPARTALLHSIQTVSVMPNSSDDSGSDKGRFCFCISPTLTGSSFLRFNRAMAALEATAGAPAAATQYYQFSQGCKIAYLNPETEWDPATSFQVLTPASEKTSGEGKDPKTRNRVSAPPPVPSNNQWKFIADPNATGIAGTITTETNNAIYYENGCAEAIRPVAMSVWFQRDASDMLDGGEVAIALMPPKSLAGNLVPYNWDDCTGMNDAIWGGQGPIQNVENLSQVPGAYSGPLRNGAYSYWLPSCVDDYNFVDMVEHVRSDYPWIAVAGKAQTYDQGEVARLVINTVWEYKTTDQSRTTEMSEYDPEMWAALKHIMRTQPTAMANEGHTEWWKHLLKIAASAGIGLLSGGPVGAVAGASGYIMGQL